MSDKLIIKDLYKIFGPQPATALRLLEEGLSKDEIFARTRTFPSPSLYSLTSTIPPVEKSGLISNGSFLRILI